MSNKIVVSKGQDFVIEKLDRAYGGATEELLRVDGDTGAVTIEAPALNNPTILGQYVECTIDWEADDFAGEDALVTTFSKNIGDALPAGARLLGVSIGETWVGFEDEDADGTWSIEVGTADDPDALRTGTNILVGQTGFPKTGTAGVTGYAMADVGGLQLVAKITSSVDVNTAEGGTVSVKVFYMLVG